MYLGYVFDKLEGPFIEPDYARLQGAQYFWPEVLDFREKTPSESIGRLNMQLYAWHQVIGDMIKLGPEQVEEMLGYSISVGPPASGMAAPVNDSTYEGTDLDWSQLSSDIGNQEYLGSGNTHSILRLSEGAHRFLITDINDTQGSLAAQNEIPTMWDHLSLRPAGFNHIPSGSNVLFMDGHVEFMAYSGVDAPYEGKNIFSREAIRTLVLFQDRVSLEIAKEFSEECQEVREPNSRARESH